MPDVTGVGARALPVPPIVVYQSSFVPVAVSGKATAFWQYVTLGAAVGAVAPGFIVTVTVVGVLSQLPAGVCVT